MVRGIVIYTQIGAYGESRVALVGAVEEFEGDAATQTVGDVVGERAVEIDIRGGERGSGVAKLIGTLHFAVPEIPDTGAPGTTFAHGVGVASPGEIALTEVTHIVYENLIVHLRAEKGGILVCHAQLVLHGSDVDTSETVDAG